MKLCMALANLLHMYALKITDEHKRKVIWIIQKNDNLILTE